MKPAKTRPAKDRELKQSLTDVRDSLLGAQQELKGSKAFALVLIITGEPTAGRSEVVNELLAWLDPKYVSVYSPDRDDCEDRERPLMWRYWRDLPARGRIAVFFEGWYDGLIRHAVKGDGAAPFEDRDLERVRQLEQMLMRDQVRILKVHLQVDHDTQVSRLEALRASKLTRWRVSKRDEWYVRHHDEVSQLAQQLRAATEHEQAPWHVVDGTHEERRVLDVARLLDAELRRAPPTDDNSESSVAGSTPDVEIHAPALRVEDEEYERELETLQGRLAVLTRKKRFRKHGLVLAFEGMDAAGKGGAIRRITHALDARQYRVIPVGAPSQDELLYPYQWRFWREAPRCGEVVIFDRTWYGRVLVERVRGFAPEQDWRRAYDEINELERQWCEHGAVVLKFWLSVSLEEQQKRFEAREADPLKRFKVDPEDWENRKHYEDYQSAAREMIARTNQDQAPWYVIGADDKKGARLQILRIVVDALERALVRRQ